MEDISSDGWGSPQPAESSWFELGRNLFRIAPFLDQAEEDRFADWYDEKVRNFWTLSCFSVSLFIGLAYRVDHTVHLMTCLCLSMVGLLEFIEGRIKQGEPAPSWWWIKQWVPGVLMSALLLLAGIILNTALLSAEGAANEIAMQNKRHEEHRSMIGLGMVVVGLVLGMQHTRLRDQQVQGFWALLVLREVQVLSCAGDMPTTLRHTVSAWWVPMMFGYCLHWQAEAVARQLWAARVKLLNEVGELHAQVASLETTRRESLIASKQQQLKESQQRGGRRSGRLSSSPVVGRRPDARALPPIQENSQVR